MDNNMTLWLIFGGSLLFGGSILVYVLLMLFFPEWVGITGKVALNAEKSHKEGSEFSKDDFLSGF